MTLQELKNDLVLFTNDLPEYQALPEGRAISSAFYASAWGDFDLPESGYMADELGGLPTADITKLSQLLTSYWIARNGGEA